MMDLHSPTIRWMAAWFIFNDTGNAQPLADLMLEGVPIPDDARPMIAAALVGERTVKQRHKTTAERMARFIRKAASYHHHEAVKAEVASGELRLLQGETVNQVAADRVLVTMDAFGIQIKVTDRTVEADLKPSRK